MNDHRITIREVADDVGISIGSCHDIFSNVLGMEVAQESLNKINDDAELLKCIITGDEKWIYGCDVETNLIQIL